MDDLVPGETLETARRVRAQIAAREDNRDLVLMGAYRAGSDPVLDAALTNSANLDGFLQQRRGEGVDLPQSFAQMAELA